MKITLSPAFAVDAVEYASRANAILGIRDSGKTYTGTLIAEQLFACGIPFFAFDPIGRWRFLRSPGKGKDASGFPVVVAGGAVPDLPLTPENAPKLVMAAMRGGVSMVIDLYSVGLSKKDWRLIVRSSIDTILYGGDGYGQRHVFLEEAAEFIPQHVRDGMTYATVEKLARMGGNVGVGVTLINQRAEEVNKAVLELCDNLLLHRQRGKNSLLSLRKWLEAGNVTPPKEITDTLADLPTGDCWAWFKDVGRPQLVHVMGKRSFDPNRREMALPHTRAPRAVDVSEFVAAMKDALAGKKVVAPKPAPAPKTAVAAAPPKEKQVNEKEAQQLRDANNNLNAELIHALDKNGELQRRIGELQRRITALELAIRKNVAAETAETRPKGAAAAILAGDLPTSMDAIYAEVKRRAAVDPGVLKLLASRPEIEVKVQRRTLEIDGTSLKGRMARLLAGGFYDAGVTNSAVRAELRRTGPDANSANIGRALSDFQRDGFLTLEPGNKFRAVEGMKVNVVEG